MEFSTDAARRQDFTRNIIADWPDLPAATTLYAHMPRTPLTGDRKGDHFFLPLEQSLQHPYTQFNRTWKGFVIRNTITIDIDEPMALEVFRERAGLEPDMWVLNPHKAMSGHVSLVLPKAVFVPVGGKPRPWFQGIRRQPWEVLLLIEEWLVAVCRADKAIVTQKTKTPGHPDHVTYWREGNLRSLGELAEWIDWSRVPQEVTRGTLRPPTGRNDTLYMRALYAGCDYAAGGAESVEDVIGHLTARVDSLNDFAEPLPLAEVWATLKSAAKRAWARRDTWKPRCATQQAKSTATREQRTEGTLKRLVDAGRQLVDSGIELAKKALARAAHAGINTVRRYWDRVQSACLQGSTEGDPSNSLLIQRPPAPRPTPEPSHEALEASSALNAPAQVPKSRKAPVLKVLVAVRHSPRKNLLHSATLFLAFNECPRYPDCAVDDEFDGGDDDEQPVISSVSSCQNRAVWRRRRWRIPDRGPALLCALGSGWSESWRCHADRPGWQWISGCLWKASLPDLPVRGTCISPSPD